MILALHREQVPLRRMIFPGKISKLSEFSASKFKRTKVLHWTQYASTFLVTLKKEQETDEK